MRHVLLLTIMLSCGHRAQVPPPPMDAPTAPLAVPPERRVPDPGLILGECSPELAQGLFVDPSAYKVLILRFNGDTERDQEFGKKVAGTLRTSFERHLEEESKTLQGKRAGVTPEQFEVRLVGCSVPGHKDARLIGQAWGADLVLWGTASCALDSPEECSTINIVDSTITAGRDVTIGGAEFYAEYKPSATLIQALPLNDVDGEGVPIVGRESASMMQWDFPRVVTPEPLALLNLMIGLEAFSRPDYVSAAYYLQRAEEDLEISTEAAQRILDAMTFAYLYAGEPQKALARAEERVEACGEEPECLGAAINSLGMVFHFIDDQERGLEQYERALIFHQQVGDIGAEAATLNNIGEAYSAKGDETRALGYYEQALPMRRQAGDLYGEAETLNSIGTAWAVLGDNERALDAHEQALVLLRQIGDTSGEAVVLSNIGLVWYDLGDEERALEYYEQALPHLRQVGNRHGEANTLNHIGQHHEELGEHERAIEYYTPPSSSRSS